MNGQETTNGKMEEETSSERPPEMPSENGHELLPTENPGQAFLYDHGFTNGVLKVAASGFEDYISSVGWRKLANEKLTKLKVEIEHHAKSLKNIREEITSQKNTVIRCTNEIQLLHWTENELSKQKEECESEKQFLERERNKINPYHSGAVAIILLVTGAIFILADIFITHGIFYNALDMPSGEAWILALGLSFIAFIIKPAVDRVFEEPYLAGENKKLNHRFLLIVGVVAIISLGFLGYYRSVAYKFEKEMSMVRADKNAMADQYTGKMPSDVSAKISDADKKGRELGLQQLDHWAIVTVFTISSVLFALAGAICFSIGLPLSSLLWKKRKLSKKIRNALSNREELQKQIVATRQTLSEKNTQKEQSESILQGLPDLNQFELQFSSLKEKESELLTVSATHSIEMEKTWYLEGYQRGEKYDLTEDLVITPLRFETILSKPSNAENRPRQRFPSKKYTQGPEMFYGNYLHQQLRSMIDYNFNKKSQNGNGHED